MEDLNKLIEEAQELKNIDYQSPRVALWENRCKRYISGNYGHEYLKIFDDALSWGRVISPGEGPEMHLKAMERAIEFLEALKKEPKK